jgi:hypothetical protein
MVGIISVGTDLCCPDEVDQDMLVLKRQAELCGRHRSGYGFDGPSSSGHNRSVRCEHERGIQKEEEKDTYHGSRPGP